MQCFLAYLCHIYVALIVVQKHALVYGDQYISADEHYCESTASDGCATSVQKDHLLLQMDADRMQPRLSKTGLHTWSPSITLNGRQLLVDGEPFHIKGVNWNPIGWNQREPKDRNIDYPGYVERDGDLMAAAGINVIRTYGPLTDTSVLDALWRRGIWVMNTVYAYGRDEPSSAVTVVNAVKHHPAILMWVIGNEWNYNGIYAHIGYDASIDKINKVADLVKKADPHHPVSSIYGGLPSHDALGRLANIDVWGMNVYSGDSFKSVFDHWASRSDKPMYFGEYGADAYNKNINNEDQQAQAHATRSLTNEILQHSSTTQGGVCLGGILFEFADEWWKDQGGQPFIHDVGGIAPGGGPHPDATFNEEWWGIVDIARVPRLAYHVYRRAENPMYRKSSLTPPAPVNVVTKHEQCPMSRRRRHLDMCSCRRRQGSEDSGLLKKGWKCEGPSIVPVA